MTVNIATWEHELANDNDKHFILDGIKNGFMILSPNQDGPSETVHCSNYKSATCQENAAKVEQQIAHEIDLGHYQVCDSPPPIVSSIGAVMKKSGGVRIIHDCSRPSGCSVNSYASKQSFKYETVDSAVDKLPVNGWMAKVDLSSAYRSVPIHPSCFPYTGLHWTFEGSTTPTYFFDTRLPFGGTECPEKFQRLASSITRMLARKGHTVIAYLDDFLAIAPTYRQCKLAYEDLLLVLQSLGFTINWDKVVEPSQCVTFLGVEINSITQTLSLPMDKLLELKSLLTLWEGVKKTTKHMLQQLIGKLNWAARCVKGGRTFMRRLISAMCSLKRKHYHIRLSVEARADITWWVRFLSVFNGTVHFVKSLPVPAAYLTSDACTTGGAAVFKNDWFYVNWEVDLPSYSSEHINIKELLAIVIAARRWAHAWTNQRIVVYTDSMCVMYMINKGSSTNTVAMCLIRELFWISVTFNFILTARHIRGADNVVSDFLSRLEQHPAWPAALPYFHLDYHNMSCHMSHKCFIYLQTLGVRNGVNCSVSVRHSSLPHSQTARRQPILL